MRNPANVIVRYVQPRKPRGQIPYKFHNTIVLYPDFLHRVGKRRKGCEPIMVDAKVFQGVWKGWEGRETIAGEDKKGEAWEWREDSGGERRELVALQGKGVQGRGKSGRKGGEAIETGEKAVKRLGKRGGKGGEAVVRDIEAMKGRGKRGRKLCEFVVLQLQQLDCGR